MDPYSSITDKFSLSTLSIPSIRLSDIVDIALVAILIYVLIKWIRETRAWSLFRGIIVIVIVSLLSYQFHFYTLSWIIEKTFSVGVIALLVIFQPELRKALEQIGEGGFSGLADMLKITDNINFNEKSVEEIVKACKYLSERRVGALIAVERKNKIPPSEDSVLVDGVVSYQLISNLFTHDTPLHDGALTIRDNRVNYASNIFPVSESGIGQELGTRHRAAVGASEVYDAYIVVVSEETGAISLAINGRLDKSLTSEQLRKRLMELVASEEDENRNSIRKKIRDYAQVEIPLGRSDRKGGRNR